MDWSSVVSIAITGVVGIAGVTGTIVSARMAGKTATKNLQLGISAENDRAKKAEKRGIYTVCLTGLSTSMLTTIEIHNTSEDDKAARKDVEERYKTELRATIALIIEASLIAPKRVLDPLEAARHELMRTLPAIDQGNVTFNDWLNKATSVYAALSEAMRVDLGEPVGPVEE